MIIKAIEKRRSVRKFKTDSISNESVLEIIKAAQFAPEAMHKQGIEFLVITNEEIKKKINEILSKKMVQDYIGQAPIVIIPIADNKKAMLPIQDLSVASENIFLQATELGFGSVWKNVSEESLLELRQVLNLTDNYTLINLIPIGYPEEVPQPHGEADFSLGKIRFIK
jgi:nitroreductase